MRRVVGLMGFLAVMAAAGCTTSDTGAGWSTACDPATATARTVELDVDVGLLAPMAAGAVVIHTPPCVDPATAPVVLLFHGGGLDPASWIDPPVDGLTTLDRLSRSGEVGPVVVALPGGSDGGHFFAEHALTATLDTIESWRGAPIERLSAAGFSAGALTAGESVVVDGAPEFERLGLFGAIWSRGLSNDLADLDAGGLEIYADTGIDDGGGEIFVPDIAAAAAEAGVPMTVERHPGGHTLDFVASRIADWWRWLAPASG